MAMNDEKRFHCSWKIYADIGSSDSVQLVGSFSTIMGFWRLFNGLGERLPLDKLPNCINFRMIRDGIQSKTTTDETKCMFILYLSYKIIN